MSENKPFLLLDVDGPLNPYARSNNQLRKTSSSKSETPPEGQFHAYKLLGFKVWLNKWHGEQLLALTDVFDLVWATTWEKNANSLIGPRIGLPDLPVIEFTEHLPPQPPKPGLHWKTAVINAYCYQRPFAWVDDEVRVQDGIYLSQWHPHPFLTMMIHPAEGLVQEHFTRLREWAEGGMYGE